ncbi:hypothetical protein BDN67DRAFT_975217 [Paxillus ammoniavirescens]|nr:hypothetical protein BDN67DRAFT_975217 [Paxillus ammoniavirescens]
MHLRSKHKWKLGSEGKWFEVGRVVVKSASLRAINGRRVQGIEFWDYWPTTNSEIHGL